MGNAQHGTFDPLRIADGLGICTPEAQALIDSKFGYDPTQLPMRFESHPYLDKIVRVNSLLPELIAGFEMAIAQDLGKTEELAALNAQIERNPTDRRSKTEKRDILSTSEAHTILQRMKTIKKTIDASLKYMEYHGSEADREAEEERLKNPYYLGEDLHEVMSDMIAEIGRENLALWTPEMRKLMSTAAVNYLNNESSELTKLIKKQGIAEDSPMGEIACLVKSAMSHMKVAFEMQVVQEEKGADKAAQVTV